MNTNPGRRDFLKTALAAGLAAPLAHGRENTTSDRINILFMMDDQHRGDCLGVLAGDWLRTPNLDRLVQEGALFQKAYTSLPSCIPARVSLLTGKSPWGHGLLLYTPMAEEYPNEMPRVFTKAGYRTHAVGKMHFDDHKHGYETIVLEEAWRGVLGKPVKRDYRNWFEKNHPDKDVDATGLHYTDHRGGYPFPYNEALHATNWTAQQAVDFLDTYDEERPWFLKVSFKRPHPPFDAPKRLMDEYEAKDLPMPKVGDWAKESFGSFTGTLEEQKNAPRGVYSDEEIHKSRAAYYASITHVDEQIGRVVEALEKRGELENTLILFTADHGDMMGDNHLWRKTYFYEGSARIPMIVRWPENLKNMAGAKRGQILNHLAELRDVFPTFLDAADLPKPDDMDGMSLLAPIRDNTAPWREILDCEHGNCYWKENAWVGLTDGRYKYTYFTTTGKQQLFDLETDPHELVDLAGDPVYADLLQTWRKRMIDHLSVRGEPWVKDGDLGVLEDSIRYGVNEPRYKKGTRV